MVFRLGWKIIVDLQKWSLDFIFGEFNKFNSLMRFTWLAYDGVHSLELNFGSSLPHLVERLEF